MKRSIATALFITASLLAAGKVSAQNRVVEATIPFYFAVGNTVLPSGTYIVSVVSENPDVLLIRNKDQWNFAALVTTAGGSPRYEGEGKLVFNRYGDAYFLSEILCPSAAITSALPTSKMEHRARMREASLEQPEQVLLALN